MSADANALLDTIAALAMEIAQQCPDAADRAKQIAMLAGEVRTGSDLDRGAVQDALEATLEESDISDGHVRTTTEAVVKAVKGTA